MSEVQAANACALYGIGTDAKVRSPTWGQYSQGLDVENAVERPSKKWYEKSFLLWAVDTMEVRPDKPSHGHYWKTATETELPDFTRAENRNAEAAYIYQGAIAHMDLKSVVCIHDMVGGELCISASNGQKVFKNLRSAISHGNNICISFENVKSLSPSFLDSAIGQLYSIWDHKYVDEKLSFENISPGRKLIVDRAIREAKEYYSDPEGYRARMKEIFADDRSD